MATTSASIEGKPYAVYEDPEQWVPFFKWFWIRPTETGMGHGPYPAKWIAELAARLA
jgi:hypothetical protein